MLVTTTSPLRTSCAAIYGRGVLHPNCIQYDIAWFIYLCPSLEDCDVGAALFGIRYEVGAASELLFCSIRRCLLWLDMFPPAQDWWLFWITNWVVLARTLHLCHSELPCLHIIVESFNWILWRLLAIFMFVWVHFWRIWIDASTSCSPSILDHGSAGLICGAIYGTDEEFGIPIVFHVTLLSLFYPDPGSRVSDV